MDAQTEEMWCRLRPGRAMAAVRKSVPPEMLSETRAHVAMLPCIHSLATVGSVRGFCHALYRCGWIMLLV